MEEEARWYIAHTYSGYENKVASNILTVVENDKRLRDLILEVAIPTEKCIEIKEDGSKKETERKLFPGYVLVKMVMNNHTWYLIRNLRGCTGFLGPNANEPTPLTEEEVRELGVEKCVVEAAYAPGDAVDVIDGPLEGFSGVVESVDIENNNAQVTISMFGRETTVEFELDQLEKSDAD